MVFTNFIELYMTSRRLALLLLISLALLFRISSPWCLKTSFYQSGDSSFIDYNVNNTLFLAVSQNSNAVNIYDATNYNLVYKFPAAGNSIIVAKFSKDGLYIGIGYQNGTVNLIGGTSPFSPVNSTNTGGSLVDLDFNQAKTRILVCYGANYRILTAYTLAPIGPVYSTTNNIIGCRFSRNDDVGITDSNKRTQIYTFPNSLSFQVTQANNNARIDFRPTTAVPVKVIYGCGDKKGYTALANVNTSTSLVLGAQIVTAACYSKTGAYFAYGGQDKIIWIMNGTLDGNNVVGSFTNPTDNILDCAFSYDGNYLVVGGSNGGIYVYSLNCSINCPVGYYVNGNICTLCQSTAAMIGCSMCLNGTICLQCYQGYFINSSAYNCSSCNYISGCSTCANSTYCVQCNAGYYVTAGNLCATCNSAVPGCLSCNSTPTCYTCHLDYYLTGGSCTLCSTITGCLRCNTSSNCYLCANGYFKNGTICSPCSANCLTCNVSASNCTSCIRGYYASASYVCTTCNTTYTNLCLQCNSTVCLDCKTGTYLAANGTCVLCTSPCATCSATGTSSCLSCVIGYYLNGTTCDLCTNNCSTCMNSTNCTSCFLGYYLVTASSTCATCKSLFGSCSTCSNTTCFSCVVGTYLFNSTTCSLCTVIPGCLACNSSTVCQYCNAGYFLNGLICTLCTSPCQTCFGTATNCTNCITGYYLSTNTCNTCANNCMTCTNSTFCLSCNIGYYLDTGNVCSQCSSIMTGCLDCLNSSYCISCEIHRFIASGNGACTLCTSPCVTCNGSTSTSCLSCQLGYYFSAGSCTSCITNCSECTTSSNCFACNVGFFFNSSLASNQCLSCNLISVGCQTCNSTYCYSCQTGYFFNTSNNLCGLCSKQLSNCLDCLNSSYCEYCSYGYYLSATNSSCLTCSIIPGCDSCSNSTVCVSCKSAYYQVGGSCTPCPTRCITCTTTPTCLTCTVGYIFNSSLTDCVLCDAYLQGCSICSSTSVCIECDNGYYINSSSCSICRSAMIGCLFCNSSSICTTCEDGYYIDTAAHVCKLCSSMAGCQLCNSSSVCLSCENGYYLQTSSCILCISTLSGCLYCNGSGTCLTCQSGYYLDSVTTHNCFLCSAMAGCIFCNASNYCLQCNGGYYLNTSNNTCIPCAQQGCEVCLSSNPLQCVTCNSGYYFSANNCIACPQQGCLTCNSSVCLSCDSGYYLLANGTCALCSLSMGGCAKCTTGSVCLECMSLYYLSSPTCSTCGVAMVGCSFCTNNTVCLACDSGFYLNTSLKCSLCTTITGCLMCSNASTCLYCQAGYYLGGGICNSCATAITNCYDCISSLNCTSCQSGFTLTATGTCTAMQLGSGSTPILPVPELTFTSYYVNQTTLKHVLSAKGMNYTQVQQNWASGTKIYVQNKNTSILLTIYSAEFGSNGYTLIFYTNNPLNLSFNAINITRRLQQSSVSRILTGQSIDTNLMSSFSMTSGILNAILPNLMHEGDLTMTYSLTDPQFYISYLNAVYNSYYFFFGVAITGILFIMFFMKSVCTIPISKYQGEISGHIFALKCVALSIYPVFAEYVNYCYGFMSADIPWPSTFYSWLLANTTDTTPLGYLVYFNNMNFACMYLSAFGVILVLYTLGYIALKQQPESKHTLQIDRNPYNPSKFKLQSYSDFLYNFFGFGLVFAGCSSAQGAILNPLNILTINGSMYILGILVYLLALSYVIYELYLHSISKIFKLRLFIKASLLSLAHFNPIYIVAAVVVLDIAGIAGEYYLRKCSLICDRLWITNQLLATLALGFLFFLPECLAAIYTVSAIVIIIIVIEIVIHYKEVKAPKERHMIKPVIESIDKKLDKAETDNNFWNLNMEDYSLEKKPLEDEKVDGLLWKETANDEDNERRADQIDDETKYQSTKFQTKGRNRRFRQDKNSTAKTNVLKVNQPDLEDESLEY